VAAVCPPPGRIPPSALSGFHRVRSTASSPLSSVPGAHRRAYADARLLGHIALYDDMAADDLDQLSATYVEPTAAATTSLCPPSYHPIPLIPLPRHFRVVSCSKISPHVQPSLNLKQKLDLSSLDAVASALLACTKHTASQPFVQSILTHLLMVRYTRMLYRSPDGGIDITFV